jgi:hypothetical protein
MTDLDAIVQEAMTPTEDIAPVEQTETQDVEAPVEAEPSKQDIEERLRKSIANRERTIGAKNAALASERKARMELESRLAQLEAQLNAPKPPKQEDYQDYGDYHAAKIKYELLKDGTLSKQETVDPESIKSQAYEQAKWEIAMEQKTQAMDVRDAELGKVLPDYLTIYQDNAQTITSLPPEILQVALLADDPNLALYVLAKEGAIDSLAEMHPVQAAMAIQAAQHRGQKELESATRRSVSNAPSPIGGLKGTKSSMVDPLKLDEDAFRKKYKL